jgi:2-methylaconitate cis-trans-isomerase PrpF
MSLQAAAEQRGIPCVLMRGGTSKALFFHEHHLPTAGTARDALLKRIMGSPDPLQIDGLGGSRLVTSKVAIIRPSSREDADVDYLFAQVDIERDLIGYSANCGNISAAVGPFAIDEGLVEAREPLTTVRIYNRNTDSILVAQVPVQAGKAQVTGDCVIAGVPGSGAGILLDYTGTVGATTGRLLPTGQPSETLLLENGESIEITLCGAGNPCVMVAAADLGLEGSESPDAISANPQLIQRMAEIQAKAGQRLGFWDDWRSQDRPGLPLLLSLAEPASFHDSCGEPHPASSMDVRARLIFLGKCHDSLAATGAICLAAASRISGSIAHGLSRHEPASQQLRIGHPLGVMEVGVSLASANGSPEFSLLGFRRTARCLMAGVAFVP